MPIGSIELQERATAPGLPETGRQKLYLSEDGQLRVLDSEGASTPLVRDDDARLENIGSDTKSLIYAIALG